MTSLSKRQSHSSRQSDEPLDQRTLAEVLNETAKAHWEGRRCYPSTMSQAMIAIRSLRTSAQIAKSRAAPPPKVRPLAKIGSFKFEVTEGGEAPVSLRIDDIDPSSPLQMRFADVTKATLMDAVNHWKAQGASPTGINTRLGVLSVMGIDVKGCRVRVPRKLKWWLTPDHYEALKAHYEADSLFMRYVEWVTFTGLRLEEVLRLKRSDFSSAFTSVTVPGTKTDFSQKTLPLSTDATDLAKRVFATKPAQDPRRKPIDYPMFDVEYTALLTLWREAMDKIGVTHETATPRALRRGAARHLHSQKGMPLDMLRQYLSHSNVQTTMGYPRLTGGYDEEQMRKWLT